MYSAGFFLTVSVESMLKVAKYCFKNNRTYCLNLSDIVFGNETEAASYAEVNRFLKTEIRDLSKFSIFIFNVLILFVTQVSSLGITDVGEIGKKIAMLPKENGSTSRLVIITQGSDPFIVVQHGKVLNFPVESLANEAIVDFNGAVDAFVGGFLVQFVLSKSIDVAVKFGNWTARYCIQKSGCTMPEICDFICDFTAPTVEEHFDELVIFQIRIMAGVFTSPLRTLRT